MPDARSMFPKLPGGQGRGPSGNQRQEQKPGAEFVNEWENPDPGDRSNTDGRRPACAAIEGPASRVQDAIAERHQAFAMSNVR